MINSSQGTWTHVQSMPSDALEICSRLDVEAQRRYVLRQLMAFSVLYVDPSAERRTQVPTPP